ncbi:MAG: MotA/TolQ/ExbB proton channel family protein [Candidatus Pacebacteria bacterium]|jgi:flagellar motor component MotA|nr:MotA/TolQ/ExbB proton channel family protein [Candidatus Paceibacterota bacterium]
MTKISFLILLIFACTSIWVGNKTYLVDRMQDYSQKADVGWFVAESCLALGMVGTVTGFLIMLGTAFTNIDVSNSTTLQRALSDMAIGMSTALYTTLIGLVCSLIIKVQLVNLEVALNE